MIGLFIVSNKIWRVESCAEAGTHIHYLCMILISRIHRVIARNCSLKKVTNGVEESAVEEVFVPKRKLELILKMYLLYFKVYFKFVFHTLMGVATLQCIYQ